MSSPLFDDQARALRQLRAARLSGDGFLENRAFHDCIDRLADIRTGFAAALIAGRSNSDWQGELASIVPRVAVGDPRGLAPESFDLCLSIGGLETSNDLVAETFVLRHILRPGGLLIGAIVGGNSLPRLRAAMLAADRLDGHASPRLHPSIDGPSLAALLTSVGFIEPVIDIDRVDVDYPSLDRLVGDLRAMGCTNLLTQRSKKTMTRGAFHLAQRTFNDGQNATIERFELLHFAAWTPKN